MTRMARLLRHLAVHRCIAGLVVLLCLFAALPAVDGRTPAEQQDLAKFASELGLREIWPFVETVTLLRHEGRLPPRYVTKDAARARGWRGGGLCLIWPGHSIGGDRFFNAQRLLPTNPNRRYFEADLDSTCEQRGASRLVFSNDGLIFVTVDHYRSFRAVP
jgi:ribonuclease T1